MPDPKIDRKKLATEYGFALAFMNSDPELKTLFNKAVKNTWVSAKFVAELRNTKWFKTHSANVRNAIMQKTSDPATWKASVDQMLSTVQDEWGKLFGGADHDPGQLRKWAETAQMMGWSESELVDHMVAGVNFQSLLTQKNVGGTAAETKSQLDQLSAQYGVGFTDAWKNSRLKAILNGSTTAGGVQAQVKALAKQQYGAFADRLDAGETMLDIADPYISKMADLLELDPNQVKLTDSSIQKALTQRDAKGQLAPMNLADFADSVRKDDRWQYTKNARQDVANVTRTLLQAFGVAS